MCINLWKIFKITTVKIIFQITPRKFLCLYIIVGLLSAPNHCQSSFSIQVGGWAQMGPTSFQRNFFFLRFSLYQMHSQLHFLLAILPSSTRLSAYPRDTCTIISKGVFGISIHKRRFRMWGPISTTTVRKSPRTGDI